MSTYVYRTLNLRGTYAERMKHTFSVREILNMLQKKFGGLDLHLLTSWYFAFCKVGINSDVYPIKAVVSMNRVSYFKGWTLARPPVPCKALGWASESSTPIG